jgi:hypothetical protein
MVLLPLLKCLAFGNCQRLIEKRASSGYQNLIPKVNGKLVVRVCIGGASPLSGEKSGKQTGLSGTPELGVGFGQHSWLKTCAGTLPFG